MRILGRLPTFGFDPPLTPVCSPRLVKELGGLTSPHDPARYPLLHERDTYDWRMWLKTADAEKVDAERGLVFDNPSLVDSAAIGGKGVAMGRPALLGHMLDEGLLVQPFDIYFRTPSAYYLVYRDGALGYPKIRGFRDFLMDGMRSGNGREIS